MFQLLVFSIYASVTCDNLWAHKWTEDWFRGPWVSRHCWYRLISLVRLPLIIVSVPLRSLSLRIWWIFCLSDISNSSVCAALGNDGGQRCLGDRWDTTTTKLVLLLCNHEACPSRFNCSSPTHGQMARTVLNKHTYMFVIFLGDSNLLLNVCELTMR